MNPVTMTIINPQNEYWASPGFETEISCSQKLYATDWAMGLTPLGQRFSTLPNDKICLFSKLKAFADNKENVTQNMKLVFHRKHCMGKGENDVYQLFLLFLQYFQKVSFIGLFKVGIAWLQVKGITGNM